jgi:hypothetical protein
MLHLLHQALRGMFDFNALPKALQGVFKAVQVKRARQGNRGVRRFLKARQYLSAALAGGGAREVARRSRQIAAGQLQVSTP